MRHNRRTKIFQRSYSERKALFNSLARAVIISERITTTAKKAKEAVKIVDSLITWGKRNDLHARRLAFKILKDRDLVKKLFDTIAPRFKNRNGGYTRVLLGAYRKGDGAQMAILELLDRPKKEVKAKAKEEIKLSKKKIEAPSTDKEEKKEEAKQAHKEEAKPVHTHTEEKVNKPQKKKTEGFRNFFKKERDSL